MGVVFKRKNSPYWWLAYRKGRKRVRETSGTKAKSLAQEILRQRETDSLLSGRHSFPDKKRTVGFFTVEFLEWVKANRRPHTLRSYATILKTFRAFLEKSGKGKYLVDIDLKLLDDYKRQRLAEAKTWTANNHIIVLKAFFNKADEWGYLEDNPTKRLKPVEVTDSKPIRFLSEREYKKFMEICQRDFHEFFSMFYVLVHTGLRKGELLSLEWDDVDLESGFIHIRSKEGFKPKRVNRKTGKAKERIIPIHDGIKNVLYGLPRNGKKVFRTYDKHRLRRVLIKVANKAGIKGLTRLHELRHSYASFLVKKGVDIYKIKELLGHSEIKDTMKYAHMPAVYMKDDVKLLEDLD